jgi:hypothetical protein
MPAATRVSPAGAGRADAEHPPAFSLWTPEGGGGQIVFLTFDEHCSGFGRDQRTATRAANSTQATTCALALARSLDVAGHVAGCSQLTRLRPPSSFAPPQTIRPAVWRPVAPPGLSRPHPTASHASPRDHWLAGGVGAGSHHPGRPTRLVSRGDGNGRGDRRHHRTATGAGFCLCGRRSFTLVQAPRHPIRPRR